LAAPEDFGLVWAALGCAMTVAAGFVCKNGIVLCADTEITAGTGKYQQSKIVHLHPDVSYAVYAGDATFVAEIVPRLHEKIGHGKNSPNIGPTVGAEWKRCFREYYTKPRKEEKTFAYLLLTLWQPDRLKLFSALANNFYEVDQFEVFGSGADVFRAAVAQFYTPNIDIDAATTLGVYGVLQAKQYAQGCGGETEVVSCKQIAKDKVAAAKTDANRVKAIEARVQTFVRGVGPAMFSFASRINNEKDVKRALDAFTASLVRCRKEERQAKERAQRAFDRKHAKWALLDGGD
jgi:20S proteasome alpha/beta subunit